jgi:hypothetical protein
VAGRRARGRRDTSEWVDHAFEPRGSYDHRACGVQKLDPPCELNGYASVRLASNRRWQTFGFVGRGVRFEVSAHDLYVTLSRGTRRHHEGR